MRNPDEVAPSALSSEGEFVSVVKNWINMGFLGRVSLYVVQPVVKSALQIVTNRAVCMARHPVCRRVQAPAILVEEPVVSDVTVLDHASLTQ